MRIFFNNCIVTSLEKNHPKSICIAVLLSVFIIFSCNNNKYPAIIWEETTLKIGTSIPEIFFEENVWLPKYTDGDNNWYTLYLEEKTHTYSGLSIYLAKNKIRGISFSFENKKQISDTDLKLQINDRIIEFKNILPGEYFDNECFYSKVQLSKNLYKINIYGLNFSKKDYCAFN